MTNDSERSPDGSGYSAEPEPEGVSAVPVSIPNAAQSLRENAEALNAYLKSFDEHARSASDPLFGRGGYGIEERVFDLFQLTGRLASSIHQGLLDTASAIEARRAATPQSDAVHESAASEAGDAPPVEVRP